MLISLHGYSKGGLGFFILTKEIRKRDSISYLDCDASSSSCDFLETVALFVPLSLLPQGLLPLAHLNRTARRSLATYKGARSGERLAQI